MTGDGWTGEDYDVAIRAAVGDRLRTIRKGAKLTQDDLAARARLLRSNISRIELGRVSLRLPTLFALAAAMEIDACDLLPTDEEIARALKMHVMNGREEAEE
jgi:transcriptional regulator with XRE-family HTH domain